MKNKYDTCNYVTHIKVRRPANVNHVEPRVQGVVKFYVFLFYRSCIMRLFIRIYIEQNKRG
jgi:hypothetical protein